ncbi:MAG TPA: site-2 protease family protein [Candidatus Acidoferrum sp.]|jgi:Zn-dependent protease
MPDINAGTLVFGFIWYVAFLFSTTCHEASHALVAKLGGDDTAERGGQITLNPVPHIRREPWGMVLVPILSFLFFGWMIGWASAPMDSGWQQRYPRRAALMALAGPAANFTLMIIAAILIRIGNGSGWFVPGVSGQPGILGVVLEAFFRLNLLLGIFNLFPAPPLDGSTGIMVFMGDGTAQRYLHWLRTTPYRSLGLLAAVLAFRYFYGPVETFATNLMIHTKF